LYTGRVEIHESSAADLILAAEALKVRSLVRLCEDALVEVVDVHNCVPLFRIALQSSTPRLQAAATAVVMVRFGLFCFFTGGGES
jgi:hypothetical protein